MHVYYFRSSVGVFRIFPANGVFLLDVDMVMFNSYLTPEEAVMDVYMHATGYDEWDKLKGVEEAPADLSGWVYL